MSPTKTKKAAPKTKKASVAKNKAAKGKAAATKGKAATSSSKTTAKESPAKAKSKTSAKAKPAASTKSTAKSKTKSGTKKGSGKISRPRVTRPSWQGSISFGLIHIPIKLYGVAKSRRVAFHQLHDKDGVRIKQKRVCPADNEEVPYEHIVRGFEIEPGRYVVIEPEELDALAPERSRAIELEKFIDATEIDPVYYDANYYAVPNEGAEQPYALLRDAMIAENRAAVARLVIHTKEHLVAMWPRDEMLVVSTLHFAEEIASSEQFIEGGEGAPATTRQKTELNAARQLVSALSSDFDIEDYRDEYREQVMELIEAKAAGEKIAVQPEVQERKPVKDLMAALEESLASISSGGSASGRPKPRRRGSSGEHRRKKASAPERSRSGS